MVALRNETARQSTQEARPSLKIVGRRRVVTAPSQSSRTAGWPVPPRYVSNDELSDPSAEQNLFADWVEPPSPSGRITPAEETLRFKQLNYCACHLSRLYTEVVRSWSPSAHKRYAKWLERHTAIRSHLIEANLGLVYDLLRRNRFSILDRDEILSEGMLAFLRAVDTFDPWLGFRFSTYACNAMMRAFSRAAGRQARRRALFSSMPFPSSELKDESEVGQPDGELLYAERLRRILKSNSADLSYVEREVLAKRFPPPSDGVRLTLDGIGRHLDVSKERVRQIERVALRKLKRALERDPVLK